MKVLIVSANKEMLPDPVAPLGAAYVAGSLESEGHEVLIADLGIPEQDEGLMRTIADYNPELIGISFRNIDNVAFPKTRIFFEELKDCVSRIRSVTSVPAVLGGSGFSLLPRELMEHTGCRYGIAGEGERSINVFIKALQKEKGLDKVPGLLWRRNGILIQNPGGVIENLDLVPPPSRGLMDNSYYLEKGGSGNIQTKRGCDKRCVYCTYPALQGRNVRLRNPQSAANEMFEAYERYGIKHFFVVDNVFNNPLEHALDFCRELKKRKPEFKWSCYAHPENFTEELASLMAESGCSGVEFGLDALSDVMLKNLRKNFTVEQALRVSGICSRSGLPFCHSLLLGGPGENIRTVRETFDNVKASLPTAVIVMIGIRILPGTPLHWSLLKKGYIGKNENLLYPKFYVSPDLDDEAMECIRQKVRSEKRWVAPGYSSKYEEKLQGRLRKLKHYGPLWEYFSIVPPKR